MVCLRLQTNNLKGDLFAREVSPHTINLITRTSNKDIKKHIENFKFIIIIKKAIKHSVLTTASNLLAMHPS